MPKYTQTATYLSDQQREQLRQLAERRDCTVSHLLKELVETELARMSGRASPAYTVDEALLHIAIGVDALLKYSADPAALEAAKEARARRLGTPRDAR